MIERDLRTLVREAITHAHASGDLRSGETPIFEVTQPQRREHGDWSTNVAFVLTKQERKPPDVIARKIIEHIPQRDWVRNVELAGKGFINFHLSNVWLHETAEKALRLRGEFGRGTEGLGSSASVEFVSANPTGPLTVAAGRHAAVGDSIARLLEFTGHNVIREYYFNDVGTQMDLLALSVQVRYMQLEGREVPFPDDGYQGEYVLELAKQYREEHGAGLSELVDLRQRLREFAHSRILGWIRNTLDRMQVHFDEWVTEQSLYDSEEVEKVLRELRRSGHVYVKDGAEWLAAESLGDTRDRVLIRSTGPKQPTYLAPDLAYHVAKAERAERIIDVFGADHHGQVPSLRAALPILGVEPDRLEFIIVQFVHLLRSGQSVPMGKRTGEFITLDELLEEVGPDAVRYTFLQSSVDHDVKFDIDQVKKQSLENPVYYVQYGHARIASILRNAKEHGVSETGEVIWDELRHEAEIDLMRVLADFEETVLVAARQRAPYRLAKYSEEVARHFHRFYTECRVLTEDEKLTRARLALARATQQVLSNALGLLGVSAPERMERNDSLEGE